MRHFYCFSLLALSFFAGSAHSEIIVQVPYVTVQAGNGGVFIRAPFVSLNLPRSSMGRPLAPPIEMAPQPVRIGDPIPVPIPKPGQDDFSVPVPLDRPVASRPLTLKQFADTFKPASGTYDMVLLHPATNKPVQVTFTLPEGQPRKVRSYPRQIHFDYAGGRDVSIRFLADGRVQVTN